MTELSTALLNVTFAIHYALVLLILGGPFLGMLDIVRGRDAPFWRTQYPILISLTIREGEGHLHQGLSCSRDWRVSHLQVAA